MRSQCRRLARFIRLADFFVADSLFSLALSSTELLLGALTAVEGQAAEFVVCDGCLPKGVWECRGAASGLTRSLVFGGVHRVPAVRCEGDGNKRERLLQGTRMLAAAGNASACWRERERLLQGT